MLRYQFIKTILAAHGGWAAILVWMESFNSDPYNCAIRAAMKKGEYGDAHHVNLFGGKSAYFLHNMRIIHDNE